MRDAYLRVTHDGRMFIYGSATQSEYVGSSMLPLSYPGGSLFPLCILRAVQVRYQNVLSTVVTPRARSISISDPSTLALQRRGLTPSRSKLFSYFSTPNSAPSSPTRSTPSSSRTALGESTDAPKFRPGSWSDDTVQHLTEQTKPYRTISPTAYKVLDAPELEVSPRM